MLKSNLPVNQNPLYAPLLLSSIPKRRSLHAQSEHDRAIEKIASSEHNVGKYVLADHINWLNRGKPDKIGNIIPDIAVYDSSGITLYEVETIDSLFEAHSISQYRVLNRSPYKALVVLAVPIQINPLQLNKLVSNFNRLNLQNLTLATINI
ncbi:hypothetical protein BSK66_26815 [Paenibacillus odorifer]|uniref:hypothetical protein n=1 Tax=Paenibacillus TaxID=44249 RepID=UPI0003E1F943|nr:MULTISPECIES: hypothetical protein [Paenibacillus]ETT49363.1 hypothetical protein C171_23860 [Paenibacillus sp. FSL H8-237]OME49573.1 hypothetical protein BSK66_26815 [Paenibacillus odorifer]